MEIQGRIIQVLPLQQGTSARTGNQWQIQSYVLETQEQYPRKVCFELFGADRIQNNQCKEGDEVTVSFDLESREFNGRWYTSVRAWRVQQGLVAAAPTAPVAAATQAAASVATPQTNTDTFTATSVDDESGDLPF